MCLFCDSAIIDVDTYKYRDECSFTTSISGGDFNEPIIQISCNKLTKLPKFTTTSTIPFWVEVSYCDSLVEIDEITDIPHFEVTDCKNLQRIGHISNVKSFIIVCCNKLISAPSLWVNNIDDCPNFMDFVGGPYRFFENGQLYNFHDYHASSWDTKGNRYGSIKNEQRFNYVCKNHRFDYKRVINGIKKLQQNRLLCKFVRLCKTRSFNEYFWNPKNMGGKWHANRILKEWN
jgi:hypothetical protein